MVAIYDDWKFENHFGRKKEQKIWQILFAYHSKVLPDFTFANGIGSNWSICFGYDNLIPVSAWEDISMYLVSSLIGNIHFLKHFRGFFSSLK